MKKQFDVILLDVDGTLLDFKRSEAEGIRKVLVHFGLEPKKELVGRYQEINQAAWEAFERGEVTKDILVTRRFTDFFGELGMSVDGQEAENFYRSCLDESAFLIEGALELCVYLKERYDLYIVTNGTSTTQYKRLALSGIDQYVKDIFVSEDAGSQKPQKEYFDYCFARIPGAEPFRMLLIGDSLTSDIRGGYQAGCKTCWYNPEKLARPSDLPIDYEVSSLDQIKEFL